MRFAREPKGYGMLGLSWCRSPFGTTVILCLVKWKITVHRRREFPV